MADIKTGVLHTKSAYAITKIDLDFAYRNKDSLESSINYLKNQENKLYLSFGCNNFDEFINLLRKIFNKNDIEVLQRFQANKLQTRLEQFAHGRGSLYKQEVQFIFDFKALRQNPKLKLQKNFEQNLELPQFNFIYTTSNIKEILNKLYRYRHFITDNDSIKATENALDELLSTGLTIKLKDNVTNDFTIDYQAPIIPNFPWGCTKEQYTRAVKTNNIQVLNEFKQAAKEIKHFIVDELGDNASPKLHRAILLTWQKNFNAQERDPALFFKGSRESNFISGVQGSLGEFQTALIFNYLAQYNNNSLELSKILGDERSANNEQLKTDVEIFHHLGLQVKNMNLIQNNGQTQLLRDLDTTIHPNKLAKYLPNSSQFLDYIANYYFNTSFADETQNTYDDLIKVLGDYLGELMNFTMADNINDTICFYVISGKYLVPASSILEAANELKLADNLEITSSFNGLPDLAYEMPFHKDRKGRRSPLYVEYWTHTYGDQSSWHPTAKNLSIYNYLISNRISIRTNFNLFKNIERYAMFLV